MMEFYDGKYNTKEDKARILKSWNKFLKNGCKRMEFTRPLYKHLSLHWGFIAHFDISGFYYARFDHTDENGVSWTFERILNAPEYVFNDDNTSGNGDLNRAMQLTARLYWPEVREQALKRELAYLEKEQSRINANIEKTKNTLST
jgi:hypothetical protein